MMIAIKHAKNVQIFQILQMLNIAQNVKMDTNCKELIVFLKVMIIISTLPPLYTI